MELEEGLQSFISSSVELMKEQQKLNDNFISLCNYERSLIPVAESTSRFVQNCDQVYVVEEPIEIQEQIAIQDQIAMRKKWFEHHTKQYEIECKLLRTQIAFEEALKKFQKMKTQKRLQQMEKQKKLQQEEEVQQKNTQYLGFLLGVVVLFVYQYLMGYVERGQWNTYSNGAWEFQASYVCIELRLGSYPFQKFRVTPRKYSGVTTRTYDTKNGIIYKYEPWVRFKKDKFYFEGQTTAKKAAIIRDVAKFCLKIKGRKGYNFGEEQYTSLSFVQEFLPQRSDDEIKKLVLVYANPFLNEVQVSQEVPIIDQPPSVEPARFANGEDSMFQDLSPLIELEEIPPDDINEQTADMIEEHQSASPNLDIAGPTFEENIREHQEAFISSAGPSLMESGCTNQITLIAPCDGTGAVNLFTELKVFRKENWNAKTGAGAKLRCALEGCSATMHEFAFLQKSGENQELWPVDIWAKLDAFEDCGWKIELLENGRRAT